MTGYSHFKLGGRRVTRFGTSTPPPPGGEAKVSSGDGRERLDILGLNLSKVDGRWCTWVGWAWGGWRGWSGVGGGGEREARRSSLSKECTRQARTCQDGDGNTGIWHGRVFTHTPVITRRPNTDDSKCRGEARTQATPRVFPAAAAKYMLPLYAKGRLIVA